MKPLFKNEIKIGTEFYKIKDSEPVDYYKCRVTNIHIDRNFRGTKSGLRDIWYTYTILGKSKEKKHKFKNVSIVAYRISLFETKMDLFQKLHSRYTNISDQFQMEYEVSKKKYPEYYI